MNLLKRAKLQMSEKRALVFGAGGFIGHHMVTRLKSEGFWVRAVDLKNPDFEASSADEFVLGDLRDRELVRQVADGAFDEVFQFAADMGGAGYIFTGEHDADIMHNSASINLNLLDACKSNPHIGRIFYSSSACIYPSHNQTDPENPNCEEQSAYPANPDSEYGWEKLFSERLYLAAQRNYGREVRIARYHNIFGPKGTYEGGKEKAPSALCRKIALCPDGGSIEVWGAGTQTRSFLFIDECIEGTLRLMRSDFSGPVNIGSDERISINDLAKMIMQVSGKQISIRNIDGPIGVMGRNSDNRLIAEKLHWRPSRPLVEGIRSTYEWISDRLGRA